MGQECGVSRVECYGLSWPGKRAAQVDALQPSRTVLMPDLESSRDWDATGNMFIEGDSLEALKLLGQTHRGQVKMIYIDPPYNTGNSFVYADNYRQSLGEYLAVTGQSGLPTGGGIEAAGRLHAGWLSLIYPRLLLARDLLTSDGVMSVNARDGGTRRCIQVQVAEPVASGSVAERLGFVTISELTRERLRRAADAIDEARASTNAADSRPVDTGLRAYRLG